MSLRPITLVVPYFLNQGMLREQQTVWSRLPEDIRAHLHVIIVDDCSPEPLRALPHVRRDTGLASLRLYRTLKKVRWNWLFSRNLGVDQAKTKWVFLTDIDHVVPAATWRRLMEGDLDPDCVYRFGRVDAPDLTPYKVHPNTWCLTKRMFDKIGGYDEECAGFYGSDSDFRERVMSRAKAVVMLSEVVIRYPREVIPDASTTCYGRKEPQDREGMAAVRAARLNNPAWQPKRLSFPYERQL